MKKISDLSFRELMDELESISAMLDDELDLDKAIESYERGTKLVEELRSRIENAEQKIQKIDSKKKA